MPEPFSPIPTEPVDFDQVADPFEQLADEILDPMEKLARLGYLEDSFEFCGFDFSIRTLYPIEEGAAALAVKDFRDTIKEPEAWANVQIGLALQSINGDPSFCPPVSTSITPKEFAQARHNYVGRRLMQPVLDYIFGRYLELLAERERVVAEAQNLSQSSLGSFFSGADFSPVPVTSDEPTTDTLP